MDDDCDGTVDQGATDAPTWYADGDGDGHGDPASTAMSCLAPAGMVAQGDDCADEDASVHPGAQEVCNLLDDDCDGSTDGSDAADARTWYTDGDGDGQGDAATPTVACYGTDDQSLDAGDCDDGDPRIHTGADEVCNGADDDCDGVTDEPDALDAPTWSAPPPTATTGIHPSIRPPTRSATAPTTTAME